MTDQEKKVITCEICEKSCFSLLKSRTICRACYKKERSSICSRCELPGRGVCLKTGLCPICAESETQSGEEHITARKIVCRVCGQVRSAHRKRNICRQCYRREPVLQCIRCKRSRREVSERTRLCRTCTQVEAKPKDYCKRCSQLRTIHNQQEWLCKTCHTYMFIRKPSYVERSKVKVKCSGCNKIRASALLSRNICHYCHSKELKFGVCSKCNQSRILVNKSQQICRPCAHAKVAGERLFAYVEEYKTPYPYNRFLFDLLVDQIDWNSINYKQPIRVRVFGRFLFTHELPEPLTWEEIDKLLEKIQPSSSVAETIRSCLYELGHLLASKGVIESYEVHLAHRKILLKISQAPEHIQPILHRFVVWRLEQEIKLRSIYNGVQALVRFWLALAQIGVKSPEQVQPEHIENYLQTLCWQWKCSKCQSVTVHSLSSRQSNESCSKCSEKENLALIKRYQQWTVRFYYTPLKTFFDWARMEKLALINPAHISIKVPAPKITHYPFEIVRQLCQYILDPSTDPTEAITLYLIIFHALNSWELCHAELPLLQVCKDNQMPSLASAYYLNLPEFEPSRGKRSAGRPSRRLDFHPGAASWLKSLLDRFEEQRQQMLKNPKNPYLLSAPNNSSRSRNCCPATKGSVLSILQRASLKAIGSICTVKILRITAAVMHADQVDGEILTYMGWSPQGAFFYSWGPREIIYPKQFAPNEDAISELEINEANLMWD